MKAVFCSIYPWERKAPFERDTANPFPELCFVSMLVIVALCVQKSIMPPLLYITEKRNLNVICIV